MGCCASQHKSPEHLSSSSTSARFRGSYSSSEAIEKAYVIIDANGVTVDSIDCTRGLTLEENASTERLSASSSEETRPSTTGPSVTESMSTRKDIRYWVTDLKG